MFTMIFYGLLRCIYNKIKNKKAPPNTLYNAFDSGAL
nr:MAG TPA: Protein of unknown function (DUF3951) [Caudoviricetes sp.]